MILKSPFSKRFPSTVPAFSNSSGLKRVFEKLRFRDVEIKKTAFSNFSDVVRAGPF